MSSITTAELVSAMRRKSIEIEDKLVRRAGAAHAEENDKRAAETVMRSLIERLARNMSGR